MTTLIYGGSSPLYPTFQVTRSVRLRASASAYFSKTWGTPTNAQKFTCSFWIKRGLFGTSTGQYYQPFGGGTAAANAGGLQFTPTDTLNFYWENGTNCNLVTSATYRDPSSWYHIVVSQDTTQATASNRVLIYVNGTQQTLSGSYPALNATATFNSAAVPMGLMAGKTTVYSLFVDGYAAEWYWIDGQALTPSSFGSINGVTNTWQPIRYSGTYGNNGFYLNFRDNSGATATTIGKDSSGNGNNWTPNNISVTAGVTNDSLVDVPGIPTVVACNAATLDFSASLGSGTYSNGNLNFISGVSVQWKTAIATMFIPSGKFYYEATITVLDSYNYVMPGACGIQTTNLMPASYVGSFANGWGVQSITPSGATKYNNGGSTAVTNASFTVFAVNDVIQIAVDVDAGRIWFGKNNVWLEGSPSAGTGASYTNLTGPIAPAVSCYNTTAQLAVNFGQRPFAYTPPTGFNSVNSFYLGQTTVPNGKKQFDVLLWTGAGQTGAGSITGLQFPPGFVWTKSRSLANAPVLFDSTIGGGTNTGLTTSSTSTEAALNDNSTNGYLTTFDSAGFSYFGGSAAQYFSANTSTYDAWCWQTAASSVSNTSGSITSTVRANPTAGVSSVRYVGTGANATVGHGLGVAPTFMFIKARDGSTSWGVYHGSLGAGSYLEMNLQAAAGTGTTPWNSTAPTSSVFTVGTWTSVNAVGVNYIAHVFAPIRGFSAFGTYTGNASTDGPKIYTGFLPRFIWVKCSSVAGTGWYIYDTARNTYNVMNLYLRSDAVDAETTFIAIDAQANGFKLRTTNAQFNGSGATFLYMAFAENPLQYALAR